MTTFLSRLFNRPARRPTNRTPTARRPRLGVEMLEARRLMAAALGPAVDVTGTAVGGQNLEGERSVARADNGNYAIVWQGYGDNGDGIYVRLFNNAGTAL